MKVIEASTTATFKASVFKLDVLTGSSPAFFDITDEVAACVRRSETRNGMVNVFSQHTTAAIVIQENEPLLISDMCSTLERIAPQGAYYGHNDFDIRTVHMHEDECPNGHSHCQHLVLGASECIPIIDGEMGLGEFQRIFMVELDPERLTRQALVQVMGV